jgi:mRNA interferase RelE/StbE
VPDAPHWRITWTGSASKALRKLDPQVARRILAAVGTLADQPRPAPPAGKPLKGEPGAWRLKVGDWRVVYEPQDDHLVVLVLALGHRREIYDRLT